jgi:hypothetical protein
MTSILKVLLLAMTLVVGTSVLAVAGPRAIRDLPSPHSFTDQYGDYQPASPPPWAW